MYHVSLFRVTNLQEKRLNQSSTIHSSDVTQVSILIRKLLTAAFQVSISMRGKVAKVQRKGEFHITVYLRYSHWHTCVSMIMVYFALFRLFRNSQGYRSKHVLARQTS